MSAEDPRSRQSRLAKRLCGARDKRVYIPDASTQLAGAIAAAGRWEDCLRLGHELRDAEQAELIAVMARLAELAPTDERWQLLGDPRLARLNRLWLKRVPQLSTDELVSLLEALGGLGASRQPELYRPVVSEVARRQGKLCEPGQRLTHQHIPRLAAALAELECAATPMLVALARQAELEIMCFSGPMLCDLVISFARLQTPLPRDLLIAVIQKVRRKLDLLPCGKLAQLVRGCAALEYAPGGLFRDVATAVFGQLAKSTVSTGRVLGQEDLSTIDVWHHCRRGPEAITKLQPAAAWNAGVDLCKYQQPFDARAQAQHCSCVKSTYAAESKG